MPGNGLNIIIAVALTFVAPLLLIILDWKRSKRSKIILLLLSLQTVYFCAAFLIARPILLGHDYSGRLYGTIAVNALLALALALVLTLNRQWWGLMAAVLIACFWLGALYINLPWF